MTPRSQRGDRTAEAILTAAEAQFLEHGFTGTRIDDIAAAAHVSVGTVYLHFQNKDGVYASVILRAQGIMLEQYLFPAFDLDAPPWERIERWCHAYVRFFEEQEPRAIMMALMKYGDTASAVPAAMDEALRANIARFHDRFLALFEEASDAGDLGGADPLAASRFVWGSVYGMCMTNVRHKDLQLDSEALHGVLQAGLTLMSSEEPGSTRFRRGKSGSGQIDA